MSEPGDFVVVQVYGDGRPVVVVCTRCDWQSGKGERAALLGPNGPALAHERDKHRRGARGLIDRGSDES